MLKAALNATAMLVAGLPLACGEAPPEIGESVAAVTPGSFAVHYDIPPVYAGYTGLVPVTFGVPFRRGTMLPTHKRRLSVGSSALEADFAVTGSWPDGSVKWLLIDALVPITSGVAPATTFSWGTTVVEQVVSQPIDVNQVGSTIAVRVNGKVHTFSPGNHALGRFELTNHNFNSGAQKTFNTETTLTNVSIEKLGAVRTTLLLEGSYRHADGSSYGRFRTRVRFYSRTPYARFFHTMIWDANDGKGIASLAFVPKAAIPSGATYVHGLDGSAISSTTVDRFQDAPDDVLNAANVVVGDRLDGYLEANWSGNRLFMGLRWPWQQHPMRVQGSGATAKLHAIGPRLSAPMSLAPSDVASPKGPPLDLEAYHDPYLDIRPGGHGSYGQPLSPRGVGKTYELLIWPSTAAETTSGHTVPVAIRNALLQQPILAFAAPSFEVQAGVPNPMSARDTASFPEIEGAIDRAFDWAVRRRISEGDYGAWNFGDIQYAWIPSYLGSPHGIDYRYWMNQGKGFSAVPWILWMRSGTRRFLEEGEAYARHLMDVDTCHVANEGELKFIGGVSAYSPVHFGIETWPASFNPESEYLGLYYHLTGYERAKDVIEERRYALTTATGSSIITGTDVMIPYLTSGGPQAPGADPNTLFNREHYRTIGELATIYEETGDATVKTRLEQLIDRLVASQATNGWIPGLTSNHWSAHSLNLARRVLAGTYPASIATLLERWESHLGNFAMPSTALGPRSVAGPMSLWSLVTLEATTGLGRWLDVAARTALSQALSVHDQPGGEFQGLTATELQYLGPQIRDWTVVLSRLSQLSPASRPRGTSPASYFNSGLLVERAPNGTFPWSGRHLLYVLDPGDAPLHLDFDFELSNQGYQHELLFRIHAPNGAITEQTSTLQGIPTEYATFPQFDTPPYDLETLSRYRRGHALDLSPDGLVGAYAIEIYNRGGSQLELPVWVRSSGVSVVHYLPSFESRAMGGESAGVTPFDLYYSTGYAKDGGSVVASHLAWAGSFSAKPASTSTPVTVGFFSGGTPTPSTPQTMPFGFTPNYYPDWRKVTAFSGSTGTPVCSTTLTGVDPFLNPTGLPCSFTPSTTEQLRIVVANVDWHYSLEATGILPFVAVSEFEWFDPALWTHVDEEGFLIPSD